MSTAAICVVSVCALLAFVAALGTVISVVESVLVSRASRADCPCQGLHSITVDAAWTSHPATGERAAREVH